MVFVQTWQEFFQATQTMYTDNPNGTRLLANYRHVDEGLVLKVTDDLKCVKYRTTKIADVKNFEKLSAWVITTITNKALVPDNTVVKPKGAARVTKQKRISGAQRRKAKRARVGAAGAPS